ncbi:YkgJ family cysteine cluster protein [Photobacterium kishitanii]|uniref:YkgJ family cysteine cluster protein n=1 Tax=Photobacterium kishitanii TaxID=318456 RepID=A0A2T3KL13_9GAMM|nr:YkgJ family cysteine cluster protein [Photobacterium kishitanii]PSV00381.1 hypothetical protein C9J27_04435 [Photobacterium kishitanii]
MLTRLYNEIPLVSNCGKSCNKCCGPVPLSRKEAEILGLGNAATTPTDGKGTCIFSSANGCSVYDRRPFMCRIFGASKDKALKCDLGASANKPLTKKQAMRLADRYRKVCEDSGCVAIYAKKDGFKKEHSAAIMALIHSKKSGL